MITRTLRRVGSICLLAAQLNQAPPDDRGDVSDGPTNQTGSATADRIRSSPIYFLSSTAITSKAWPPKFSGRCSTASKYVTSPAFAEPSSVFPSGYVNRKWTSFKNTPTLGGWLCMTDF